MDGAAGIASHALPNLSSPPLHPSQPNVTGLEGTPIYYSATPPPGGNLLTNTSISFLGSSWLTSDDLSDILGTPEVAGSIAQGLAALGELLSGAPWVACTCGWLPAAWGADGAC